MKVFNYLGMQPEVSSLYTNCATIASNIVGSKVNWKTSTVVTQKVFDACSREIFKAGKLLKADRQSFVYSPEMKTFMSKVLDSYHFVDSHDENHERVVFQQQRNLRHILEMTEQPWTDIFNILTFEADITRLHNAAYQCYKSHKPNKLIGHILSKYTESDGEPETLMFSSAFSSAIESRELYAVELIRYLSMQLFFILLGGIRGAIELLVNTRVEECVSKLQKAEQWTIETSVN